MSREGWPSQIDCRFMWGTFDENTITDKHGDTVIVTTSLHHQCGRGVDHQGRHQCQMCTNTYKPEKHPGEQQ